MFEDRSVALAPEDVAKFSTDERRLLMRLLATGCLALLLLIVAFIW